MFRLIVITTISAVSCAALFAQTTNMLAPGAPGLDAHWPSAAKNGFGTSNTLASKVWFTLNNGVMTEVYYPRLDVPNVQALQLLLVSVDGKRIETESEDTTHHIEVLDPGALTFRQINTANSGAYTITKTYVVDPERSSVLVDVNFRWNVVGLCRCSLYVYYDPSLNNSGMHDSARINGDWLVASDADKASALTVINASLAEPTNGYFGVSDGLTQLRRAGRITPYPKADDGNVVQTARVNFQIPFGVRRAERFTLVLSFGRDIDEAISIGQASVRKGFEFTRTEYERGWQGYVKTLPRVERKYQRQFNIAAMVLKALEDKTYRGAMIASPSIPWGGGPNANEPAISGYHAVWARDLYQVASAFLAMGDRAAANRALEYLFKVQQKPDGSFPQNSWVDGRPIGGGLQMDQVALPLVLAYQLQRTDRTTWLKHIKPAADFILSKGPATGQDRWEEKPGYSPATIAAEIAGLVCAAKIATINNDQVTAKAYLEVADEWRHNVERWTATKGRQGDGHYYLRITGNDDPDDGAKLEINSSSRIADERAILDAGFLELVRLGIKDASDPLIAETLVLIDQLIKVETAGGSGWYRYNHDAYGERADGGDYDGRTGVGRLWTLLSGERGEYDVARGDLVSARQRLDAMMAFANDGLMIPEQVWDRSDSPRPELRFGEGTGSATPLAWSMAQFIRLAINVKQGHNVETPNATTKRYLKGLVNN